MTLTLFRRWRDGDAVVGELFVGEVAERFAYTLESSSPIPAGKYGVVLTRSAHGEIPTLCDVPGEGAGLRPGNTPKSANGDILVGYGRLPAAITESRIAFSALLGKVTAALMDGEGVQIEILNVLEAA